MSRVLTGRTVIYTDTREITAENVIQELNAAMSKHLSNMNDIQYLWDYYRGKTPILRREKKVRSDICHRIVENRAYEIVSFKVGYLCGEPIQYVGRTDDEIVVNGIKQLNEMMFSENKAAQDKEIVEWQMIAGTAYRMCLPDSEYGGDEDDAPFELYTVDPRNAFVVYSSDIDHKKVFGAKFYVNALGDTLTTVYTPTDVFQISGQNGIITHTKHILGEIPIFEYPANNARLGAFEIVLSLLDAIDEAASNRADGIEQFVQAFMKFINCDIDEEDYRKFLELGAIKVNSTDGSNADVEMISSELNQEQSQTYVDYLYQAVLDIVGMPNRNANGTNDVNGVAVLAGNGFYSAEARAKDSELIFKKAETAMLRLALRICRDMIGTPKELKELKLKDIALQFTRRNYENIQSKSQVLVQMLDQPKIHPLLAFKHCGMFSDPEEAYAISMAYAEDEENKLMEELNGDRNNAEVE